MSQAYDARSQQAFAAAVCRVMRESRRRQKLTAWEVKVTISLREAMPTFLKWSEAAITFDNSDHPNYIP